MVTKKKATKKVAEKKEVIEEVTPEIVETPEVPEVKETKKEKKSTVIGKLSWWKEVHQAINTIKMKAVRWPISHRELPEDIQRWLRNKWYGTNIYTKDKEWLEKHNVDMGMIEKLKKFISDNYL